MEYVLSIFGLPKVGLKRVFAPLGVFLRHLADHFIPHHRNDYRPHLLRHRSLALMSGLLVSVKIFTIVAISLGPIAPAFSSAITQENIINLTNESRRSYGLQILTFNSTLSKAAQSKAEDMLAKGYFAHKTPDGKTPWDFIVASGYTYLVAGENLAVNFTQAESVEDAWMNSPGHKANILNKNFEEIGIGISQGEYQGHTAIFVVQMFGTPSAQQVALSEEPTQVQKTEVPNPVTSAETSARVAGDNLVKDSQVIVSGGEVNLQGNDVSITAEVTGPAVKVVAYFGDQAIMLGPKSDTLWVGQVPLSTLARGNLSVKLKAVGMDGHIAQIQLADFSGSTIGNYNLSGTTPQSSVSFMGLNFDPKNLESRFYLLFIAVLATSLILAIAVKRHIHHLPLVANGSFTVIFAALLFWAG